MTLSSPRTDDPLAKVVVPTSTGNNPAAGTPSHIQQVQAELVSKLPVPHAEGLAHADVSNLVTENEYHIYIKARTEAWKASRAAP